MTKTNTNTITMAIKMKMANLLKDQTCGMIDRVRWAQGPLGDKRVTFEGSDMQRYSWSS